MFLVLVAARQLKIPTIARIARAASAEILLHL